MSQIKNPKQLKVGENIKRLVSEIMLREGMLSRDGSLITILEAEVSPDLKNARIYFDVFGNYSRDMIQAELNKAAPALRFKLAQKIEARNIPAIRFVLDETADKALRLEELLKDEEKE